MIDADFERLVWERLDGTISAEDDALLAAMLASDGPAREHFEAIQEVARGLSGVEPASPPAELRPRIDRALAQARPRWRRRALPVGLWRPQLVYLAAGLVLGAVAVRLLVPAPALDRDLASGSMVAAPTHPRRGVSIDLAGEGTLAMWRSGDLLNVELGVRAAHRVDVILKAHEGSIGIQQVALSGGLTVAAMSEGAGVRISANGPGQATVVASQQGHESGILVEVMSEGVVVAERELRPGELRAE